MNIGIFTDQYYPIISGVVTSINMLYDGLVAEGHNVYIFTSMSEKKLTPEQRKELHSRNIVTIGGIPYPFKGVREYRFSFFYRRYVKVIDSYKLDVIHLQNEYYIAKVAMLASRKLQIPIVHTFHTSFKDYIKYVFPKGDKVMHESLMWIEKTLFTKKVSKIAEFDIVPTKKVIEDLPLYGMSKDKAVVVPSGIDLKHFEPKENPTELNKLKDSLNIPTDQIVFSYIGRLGDEKRIEKVVEAFSKALKDDDAILLIVGGGPSFDVLKDLALKNGIIDKVRFTGLVKWEDIPKYYHISDVFVNASMSETQGLTYIEALASGTPALVQKDRALDGVVIDGYNGFIFDGTDDLAQKMKNIYNKREVLSELKENALKSTRMYSKEVFAASILAIYQEAIKNYNNKHKKGN